MYPPPLYISIDTKSIQRLLSINRHALFSLLKFPITVARLFTELLLNAD